MIADYHGLKTDLATLRRTFEITLKGATLSNLVDIGSELGLGSRGIRCEPENLDELRLPAILHWDLNHFVVLVRVRGNRFEVADPARGLSWLTLDDVGTHFTGVALELVPTADFQTRDQQSRIRLSSLLRFDATSLKPVAQALLLSCFLQVFVVLAPFFIQLVIDEAILKGDLSLLVAIAIGFGALKLFEILTIVFRRIIFQLIGKVLTYDMKASVFHHLLRLPVSYFHGRSIGDVQQRFFSLNMISNFVVDGLIEAVIDGLLAIVIGIILFAYDVTLGLVVTGFVLLYAALRFVMLRLSERLETDQQVAQAEEANRFLETLKAIQTIKIAGIENEREGIWRNVASDTVNADIRVGNVQIGYDSVSEGMIGLSQIVIVFLAALAAIEGSLTVGMITAFLAYKTQFEQRLISLFDKWARYKLLRVHLERVADIAVTEQEGDLAIGGTSSREYRGAVELRSVRFRYAPLEADVLRNVSFRIEPGEFVALAGPSGQGKSTLLRLLVGIYRPSSGEVLYDGLPLSSWGIGNIRSQMGVVMQDDTLLAGSIEENISLFDANPNRDRVRWAASITRIHQEIEAMPMGYNTLVGDMGTTLSGGQKQRVMIARALYRQPRLLVLDEGTSQLDVETEMHINDALRDLSITRIAAAHRPDTLKKADRILNVIGGLVFENGLGDPPSSSVRMMARPNET